MKESDIKFGKIGNALQSVAPDHILGISKDIYDTDREQYQSEINAIVGNYIDNPEFVELRLDSENRIVYAIQRDGNFFFGCGIPAQIETTYGKVVENPEWLRVYLDNNGRLICGVQKDGNIIFGKIPSQIQEQIDIQIKPKIEELLQKVAELKAKDEELEYKINSNICAIEVESEDGEVYAIFESEGNVKDVYMDDDGDIIEEIEYN